MISCQMCNRIHPLLPTGALTLLGSGIGLALIVYAGFMTKLIFQIAFTMDNVGVYLIFNLPASIVVAGLGIALTIGSIWTLGYEIGYHQVQTEAIPPDTDGDANRAPFYYGVTLFFIGLTFTSILSLLAIFCETLVGTIILGFLGGMMGVCTFGLVVSAILNRGMISGREIGLQSMEEMAIDNWTESEKL